MMDILIVSLGIVCIWTMFPTLFIVAGAPLVIILVTIPFALLFTALLVGMTR